jgi:hypothetical protein
LLVERGKEGWGPGARGGLVEGGRAGLAAGATGSKNDAGFFSIDNQS